MHVDEDHARARADPLEDRVGGAERAVGGSMNTRPIRFTTATGPFGVS